MSDGTAGLLHRLEAWVQEEIGAQRRMLELLDEQERAMLAGDTEALAATGGRIERELRQTSAREARRRECIAALARAWSVAADALTLGSIAERIGSAAWRLLALRGELRSAAAEVLRRGRRIAAIARYHRGLLAEVVQVVGGGEDSRADERSGRIVDVGA